MTWIADVKERAALGTIPMTGGRKEKEDLFAFSKLNFLPAQLARRPVDYYKEEILTKTTLGKSSKKPLVLELPIVISALSFGSVSKEVKIACAKAATAVGTATNTGEGGMLPEERQAAKLLIAQYASGRFGVNDKYIKAADAIEIKIGQGAKPGIGGILPKEKLTQEIAEIRQVRLGQDVHSPAAHPDIFTPKDLRDKIKWIKELNQGPVIVKLAASDIEADLKFVLKAKPDAIAIDGSGGSGAMPKIAHELGISTLKALILARRILDRAEAEQELLIGGGLSTGADVAKALALGADAVYMAFAILVAMGCIYCKLCHTGKCPVGIATQDPELRKKFDIEKAVAGAVAFLKACTEEVKLVAAACGHKDIHELNKKDLVALDPLIAKAAGLRF